LGYASTSRPLEEVAVDVEAALLAPQPFRVVDPLLPERVALVVLALLTAEHLHLRRDPAHHEVEREPPAGDPVDGRGCLRRDDRVHGRQV